MAGSSATVCSVNREGPCSGHLIQILSIALQKECPNYQTPQAVEEFISSCVVKWHLNVCGPRLLAKLVCDEDEGMVQGQGRHALQMPGTGLGRSQSCSRSRVGQGLLCG